MNKQMRSQMVAVWFCDVAECSSVSVIRAAEVTDWVGKQEIRILSYTDLLCCLFHWCTLRRGVSTPRTKSAVAGERAIFIDVCDFAHASRPITTQL